jgi:hypothetical protein
VLGTEVRFMRAVDDGKPLDRTVIIAEIAALVLNSLRP